MPDNAEPTEPTPAARRRRWPILASTAILVTAAAVVLALFQPWKLWVDDKVNEAAPAGAVPISPPAATNPQPTATDPPPTATPTTAPSTNAPNVTPAGPATPPATNVALTTTPTTVTPTTIASIPRAEFISIDHGTSGTVVLLQDAAGAQFLRLENLDTTNGPDLFVYLSTNPPDGPEDQFDDEYVNLGRLEGNIGSSNYVIPTGTELARYASVVIWCDRFNSAFGAAALS